MNNITRIKTITSVEHRRHKNRIETWNYCFGINDQSQLVYLKTTDK